MKDKIILNCKAVSLYSNCTENLVCTSCDIVVLGINTILLQEIVVFSKISFNLAYCAIVSKVWKCLL